MQMTGEQRIEAPVEVVWAALNGPDALRACIPGCQSLEVVGHIRFRAAATIKVGPISARFGGEVQLADVVTTVGLAGGLMPGMGLNDLAAPKFAPDEQWMEERTPKDVPAAALYTPHEMAFTPRSLVEQRMAGAGRPLDPAEVPDAVVADYRAFFGGF